MKERINKLLKHPIKKIYFLSIIGVYLIISLTSISLSFYTFLAYGEEIKEINTQIGYILTYDNQGGTGCTTKKQYKDKTWGELCTPTGPQGYTFQGWYTSQNGGGNQVTSSSTASSNQTVYAYYTGPTLYSVLKNAVSDGYAEKYTGTHQDSMDVSKSTKDIYYWYGADETKGTDILNKNNARVASYKYWLSSPANFLSGIVRTSYINANGSLSDNYVTTTYSIRPSISLISGIEYTKGNGRTDNPYIVEVES